MRVGGEEQVDEVGRHAAQLASEVAVGKPVRGLVEPAGPALRIGLEAEPALRVGKRGLD